MLSDSLGALARTNAVFGQGSGPILLSNVMCSGFETSLFDCPHSGFELNSCGHSADAGVSCVPGIIGECSKPTFYCCLCRTD